MHNLKEMATGGCYMKIAFYGTKPYDRIWFEPMGKEYGFDIHFIEAACNRETIFMAKG